MKIAISSEAMDLDANVDPRFGRARCFIFYDTDTDVFEARSNEQVLNLPQGAGIQAAQQVIDRGSEVVLTGHCGPNAFRTLQAGGVKVVLDVQGTVRKAIEQFKQGALKPAELPDVEGHW
jgi:predicted Fe-Mo cluster-binding NifX family protein